jgi:hypothetical protein
MIGFRIDTQEFISPMPREECIQKLEEALSAPPVRGFPSSIGFGAPRIVRSVKYGRIRARRSGRIFGRVGAIYLTAELAGENGKTKISCRFSIYRILAVCAILIFLVAVVGAGYIFLVSLIELTRGAPYSIDLRPGRGWVRFLGLPIVLGVLVGALKNAPRYAADDRKLLVNFLWKTIRASPVQLPREFREGFEI